MKSAVLRTGMYFHWSVSESAPRSVREPQTTVPTSGNVRRTLIPSGLSSPVSASVRVWMRPTVPHDGRLGPGRRLPDAAARVGPSKVSGDRPRRGELFDEVAFRRIRGSQSRDVHSRVLVCVERVLERLNARHICHRRRRANDEHRPPGRLLQISGGIVEGGCWHVFRGASGGRQSRLKMSTVSRARTPFRPAAGIRSSARTSLPPSPPLLAVGPAGFVGTLPGSVEPSATRRSRGRCFKVSVTNVADGSSERVRSVSLWLVPFGAGSTMVRLNTPGSGRPLCPASALRLSMVINLRVASLLSSGPAPSRGCIHGVRFDGDVTLR
jgi:hypothetical protein